MANDALRAVQSVSGNRIRVTYKQWSHVTENHDYMSGNLDKVLETLAEQDSIVLGRNGESLALRKYAHTNITQKTCVAVYMDTPDGFLITAFLTSKPQKIAQRGKTTWSRFPTS